MTPKKFNKDDLAICLALAAWLGGWAVLSLSAFFGMGLSAMLGVAGTGLLITSLIALGLLA